MHFVVKPLVALALVAASTRLFAAAPTVEPSLAQLERQFIAPPMQSRRLLGPLFWLHGDESPEHLADYIARIAEGGNGCFTAESRPHNDWLGEGWYRDLAICLDAAKKHDLEMWIFDEKWWPSGEVAGDVPQRYASKRLVTMARDVRGPAPVEVDDLSAERIVALLAGRLVDGAIDGDSLLDLSAHLRDGVLRWDAPAGDWRIMQFGCEPQRIHGRYLVDGASADAVDWYINTVYQPHCDRFADDFGETIRGFFYDEPETHGDWGTEVFTVLGERGVDWKKALVAWKFQLAGEAQIAAKFQYQDALAEAWGRTLYGGISAWCEERGVKSIGHFLEHRNEYLHPSLCAGDMFRLQKYSHMGGIDAVFDQFVWGRREARDAPCWQTPKLGSSITHAYGKDNDHAMVEIYGARGQDLSYPEMKWWLDHMQVSGINFIIPHSFNPRSPYDTDCPPYFYNGGFEPRWPLYRVLADYSSRLSLMLTGGRHVCPVALVYLGVSAHAGEHVLPDGMSESLQDALYDCDWIPCEVLERDVRVDGDVLRLHDETYRVLIAPAAEVVPYETLERIRHFYDGGGVVIGYGILPTKSATLGRTSGDIAALRTAIWGDPPPGLGVCKTNSAGGRSYFLPAQPTPEQLQQVLADDAGVRATLEVLNGDTDHWLHVLHRVKAGRDVFFITNQDHDGPMKSFRLRLRAAGAPECWDAMRGEITSIPCERRGETVDVSLALAPNESVLLVFREQERTLPLRLESASSLIERVIDIVRDEAASQPASMPPGAGERLGALRDCAWIWFPEGDPLVGVEPGARYFRKQLHLAGAEPISRATFFGTADNSFTLYLNGRAVAASSEGAETWRQVVEADLTAALRPGVNQLALLAENAGNSPNPAGAIGKVIIDLEGGEREIVALDETWKASRSAPPGWTSAACDDSGWPRARLVAPYGAAPWGNVGAGRITLSPAQADPFVGGCMLPDDVDLAAARVVLELDDLATEQAARVSINGHDAGGFIGAPLRLDVTRHVQPGCNTIRIEPFAPRAARLVICR